MGRQSNCSLGVPVDFYWYPAGECSNHIAAAEGALIAAMKKPGRLWDPWKEAAARGEFRHRLKKAARGQLQPVDEVKEIQSGHGADLFEIRWSGLRVQERDDSGGSRFRGIEVRMLHSEPATLGICCVGLHAHEKAVEADAAATRQAQDREIAGAMRVWARAVGDDWGAVRGRPDRARG